MGKLPSFPPMLLQDRKAKTLNSELIGKQRMFAFAGEPEFFIRTSLPYSYADKYTLLVIELYKLYHDYGMSFLRCFTSHAAILYKDYSYETHLNTVNNLRTAATHSIDPDAYERSFSFAKKILKNDKNFTYHSWEEFYRQASEKQWQVLVNKIISDSNRLFDLLMNAVNGDAAFEPFRISVKQAFTLGNYLNHNRYKIFLYEKAFDARFLKNLSYRMCHAEMLPEYSDSDVKREIKSFYSVDSTEFPIIKRELTRIITERTTNGDYPDSDVLYSDMMQVIADNVRSRLSLSITDDILE